MITTLSRDERNLAYKRAQSRLAEQQPGRYQELYEQAQTVTGHRSTARARAVTRLANEYPQTFHRLYAQEIEATKKAKAAADAARDAAIPVKVRDPGLPFMLDPARSCTDINPDVFFPGKDDKAAKATAVTACRRCPFTRECFQWADTRSLRHGIWGGVDMTKDAEIEAARNLLASA